MMSKISLYQKDDYLLDIKGMSNEDLIDETVWVAQDIAAYETETNSWCLMVCKRELLLRLNRIELIDEIDIYGQSDQPLVS